MGEGRLGGEPTPSASSPRPYDGSRQLSYGAHRGPPHHGSSAPSSTAEDDPHPASTPERTTTSHTWSPPAEGDPHPAYGPPAAAAPESDTAASPGYTHPYASATRSRGGDSAWPGHGGPHEGEAAPSGDPERPARPAEFATRSEFAP
ncbi:MAG TPA: hypothetical protein VHB53_02560 [Solirubrobacterales bacterium]|nr:hypothetical protein [Solirubrobacterales bacterium]